jgi:hypothetical protein
MNSLTELNGYASALSFEFTDNRIPNVTFTTPSAVNQSQIVDEGFSFSSAVGIEILEILNASQSQPTYTINVFNLNGATVSWASLPTGVTVTTVSTGVYRLSGITSKAQWDAVKYASISMPANYNGIWSYTSTIAYYSQVSGNQSKSWITSVTVNDVVFLTTPLEFTYTASNTALVTNGTQLVNLDASYPGVTWTVIGTPNDKASISNWTTTGTGGTFTVNSTTKVFTIVGTRTQVNSRLAGLTLTTNAQDTDFSINYAVSNSLNSTTDNTIQTFKSYNLTKLTNTSPSYFIEDASFNNVTGFPIITDTPYDGTGTYNLKITPSTTTGVSTISSQPRAKTMSNAGAATTSTAQIKFGAASMSSNGTTTSYISTNVNLNDFNFGADDFTVDFWIRVPVQTSSGGIMNKISSSASGAHLGWSIALQNGYVEFLGGYNPPTSVSPLVGVARLGITSRLTADTWTHIAFSCKDGVLSTYKNGTREQQTAVTTIADSTGNLQIGKGYYFNDGLGNNNGYWRETWTAVVTAAALTPVRNENTSIDSITITNGGSGYATPPTITISAPAGGTNAVLTAVRNASTNTITAVTVTSGGSGYATAPTLTFSGGGGANAAATANISNGVITSVTVTNQGTNYTSVPSIAVSATNSVQATATAVITNGVITAVTVNNAGTGYTSNPTITLSGGTTVNGVLNGNLDEIRISNVARYVDSTFALETAAYTWNPNTKLLLHFNGNFTDDVETQGQIGTQSFNSSTKVLTLSGTRTEINNTLNYLAVTTSVDWASDFALSYLLTTPRDETATKTQAILCGSNDIEITNMNETRSYIANRGNNIFTTTIPVISDFDSAEGNTYTIGFTSSLGQFAFGSSDTPVSSLTFAGTKAQCNAKFSSVRFYPTVGVSSNGTLTYTQIKNAVTQISQTVALTGTYATYANARSFIFTSSQTYTPTFEDIRYGNFEIALVGGGGTRGAPFPPNGSGFDEIRCRGGGGGGEVIQQSNVEITNQTYSITVGAAGNVSPGSNMNVSDGGNTVAFGLTARGGKTGINVPHLATTRNNVRTGGASGNGNLGGLATYLRDNNNYQGGGGGGAGDTKNNASIIADFDTTANNGRTSQINAVLGTGTLNYSNISGTNVTGTGTGITFNISVPGPQGQFGTLYPPTITISNPGSGYGPGDTIKILSSQVQDTVRGTNPAGISFYEFTITITAVSNGSSVLTADPVGGRGVAIFWDASANSMYGYYGGGGAGDIVNQEFVNVGSGAIGNLISNPVAHNNGITTSTNFSGASGGGGGSGGNYPGSGVVGVRITSKG